MSKTKSIATSTKKPIWHFGKKLWTFARYLPTLTNVSQLFMKNLQMLIMHLFMYWMHFHGQPNVRKYGCILFNSNYNWLQTEATFTYCTYVQVWHMLVCELIRVCELRMHTRCNCWYSQVHSTVLILVSESVSGWYYC